MSEIGEADALSTSLYVVKPFLHDIPLSPEDHAGRARITCVELCGMLLSSPFRRGTALTVHRGKPIRWNLSGGNSAFRLDTLGSFRHSGWSCLYLRFPSAACIQCSECGLACITGYSTASRAAKCSEGLRIVQWNPELLHLTRIEPSIRQYNSPQLHLGGRYRSQHCGCARRQWRRCYGMRQVQSQACSDT